MTDSQRGTLDSICKPCNFSLVRTWMKKVICTSATSLKSVLKYFVFIHKCCVLFILISVISRLWSKVLRAAVLWVQGSWMLAILIIQFQNHPASSSYQAFSWVLRNMTSHLSVFLLQGVAKNWLSWGQFWKTWCLGQSGPSWIKWLKITLMAKSGTKI